MTILVLVQGFSLEAATAKTSFVSDVCSRTMILYNGTHAANQYIFAVFTCLIFVQGFSIKSAHVGHAYNHYMSQIKIVLGVSHFLFPHKTCS